MRYGGPESRVEREFASMIQHSRIARQSVHGTTKPVHPVTCGWHRDWHDCSCGLFDTLVWDEPSTDDEGKTINVRKFIAVELAVTEMIEVAKMSGHVYDDLTGALEDFIVVNWAWYL